MTTTNGTAIAVAHKSSEVATYGGMPSLKFTPEQKKLILDTCFGGAAPHEAAALIAIAEARGLNPLAQECYFVERWDSDKGRKVWAIQAGIDSFRAKAEETGLYCGQDEPEFEYDAKGSLKLARVRVYRRDWIRPCVGVARWDEYVQTKRDGTITKFWARMPHNQLAKCAETAALRKAFPKVFSRIHGAEELQQSDSPRWENETHGVGATGAPGHDEETGEVLDQAQLTAQRQAASAVVTNYRFDQRKTELQAHGKDNSPTGLAKTWGKINEDAKKQLLTLEQTAQLRDLKDQIKLVIAANFESAATGKRNESIDSLLGGDDFPKDQDAPPPDDVELGA